jgi:hypothetical protein
MYEFLVNRLVVISAKQAESDYKIAANTAKKMVEEVNQQCLKIISIAPAR